MPEIKTILSAKDETAAAFESMIARAEAATASVNQSFIGLSEAMEATFVGISIAAFTDKLIDLNAKIEEIEKSALKAGVSIGAFQELSYAASQTGVSVDDLSKGFKFLNKNLGEAENGSETAAKKFAEIGVDFRDLIALAPDKQLEIIGTAIMRLGDAAQQGAALTSLLGKSGQQLKPLFEDGAAGIETLRQKARDTGKVLSDELVHAGAEAAEKAKDLKTSWEAFSETLAAKTGPALSSTFDWMRKLIGGSTAQETLEAQKATLQHLQQQFGNPGSASDPYVARIKAIDDAIAQLHSRGVESLQEIETFLDKIISIGVTTGKKWTQKDQKEWLDSILPDIPKESITRLKETETQVEKLYASFNKLTQTDVENASESLLKFQAELRALASPDAGQYQIGPDEFQKRWSESLDKVLHDVEVKGKMIKGHFKDISDTALDYGRSTADALDNAFARFFMNTSEGLGGLVKDFARAFEEILAKATANQLMRSLFSSSGGGDAWFASIFSGLGFAGGGDPPVGKASIVGENGPELFVPKTAGTVVPMGATGGITVNSSPHIQIDSRSDRMSILRDVSLMIAEHHRQLIEMLGHYNPGLKF